MLTLLTSNPKLLFPCLRKNLKSGLFIRTKGQNKTCNSMACKLPEDIVMRLIDLIFVYLSIGSAFAAYHYFRQDSTIGVSGKSLITSVGAALVWPYFIAATCIRTFRKSNPLTSYRKNSRSDSTWTVEQRLFRARKRLEDEFGKHAGGARIYEFRDILDRYIGLTCAKDGFDADAELEILKIASSESEVQRRCLLRRNHEKADRAS